MSTAVSFVVRRARSQRELAEALKLRHEVFCGEQGVPEREELDGRDNEGLHLIAVAVDEDRPDSMGEVLGTCRLVLVGRTVQFSRLAVRASARRQGIATALLETADAETRAAGGRRLVLHAQTYARPLYEQAAGKRLPRGRHRAHRDGEGACLSYGSTR
jgi:ElaA protein